MFGVGIPVTRSEFERDLRSSNKDFVPKRCQSWLRYYALIVQHYEWVQPRMQAVGVRTQQSFTLQDFAAATRSDARVITLFSHWTGEEIELADGLHAAASAAAEAATTYDGIFDLTVCQSVELGDALRTRCPNALVKFENADALPDFWLLVYRLTYSYLAEHRTDFLTALALALRELQK